MKSIGADMMICRLTVQPRTSGNHLTTMMMPRYSEMSKEELREPTETPKANSPSLS